MAKNIIIAVLALGVIGAGFWGYQERQGKEAVMNHAENNYQRAFHDLAYRVGYLKDKVGTSLGIQSDAQMKKTLTDVWKVSAEAHSDVGQLPLRLMAFNKTEEFLSNIAEFSYRTSFRDLSENPMTDQEKKTLKTLYKDAKSIDGELKNVQKKVLQDHLKWMDVQMALASDEEPMDNTIIDGFKTVEQQSEKYNENTDFGTDVKRLNDHYNTKMSFAGKPISEKQAVRKMKKFFELEGEYETTVKESGGGADYAFYSVTLSNDKETFTGDISKNGGVPIWLLNSREVQDPTVSLNKAADKAASFLKKHGYGKVELHESSQYDNEGLFTFVKKIDEIHYLPASIRVKIALDNGELVGFDARQYLIEDPKDQEALNATPALSEEEVLEPIRETMDIQQSSLVFTENEFGEDVLCYEVYAVMDGDTYRLLINANTGDEEDVEQVESTENVFENAV
ncbi:germination protein YpeB [Bacillaceae bacterium SIJ1]|uniref:germination protein YpeB n=1 Tax=Litoribacterium kuwaitense TaxID=1398745 RepID=UPI0013EADFF5|nr:germination protein YpeB [Litoribacterium kuwaitense]NGP43688.1 germination protein YpeB [Litoribacterium kuwaitense]